MSNRFLRKTMIVVVSLGVAFLPCAGSQHKRRAPDASLSEFFIGVTYSQRGECEKAVPHFQRALVFHRSPAIYRELAECYAYQGSMESAIQTLEEALKLFPKDGATYGALGELYYELFRSGMGNEEISTNALTNLKRAWELAKDAEAGARAVEVAIALQSYDDAVGLYEALPIETRRDPQLLAGMIQVYNQRKDESRVLKALRMLVHGRLQDPSFLERVANLAISKSYYSEALSLLEQRIQLDPSTFHDWDKMMFVALAASNCEVTHRIYEAQYAQSSSPLADYSLAICASREHDYEQAATLFSRSLKNGVGLWDEKTRRDVLHDYVRTLVVGGQLDRALSITDQGLEKHPEDRELKAARFYLLLLRQEYGKAREWLDSLRTNQRMKALVTRADVFKGHWAALGRLFRGSIAYALQDFEKAQPDLEAALQVAPDAEDIVVPLAFIYDRNGDHGRVLAIYRRALEAHPDNALLLNNYSYSMLLYGEDPKLAVTYARQALAQDEDNPTYRDTLGYALMMTGDLEEAEEHLQFAYNRMPQVGEICEHLGDLWFRKGNRAKARELWMEAIENGGVDEQAIRRKLDFLDR